VTFERGVVHESRWWTPRFVEDDRRPFAQLRDEFRTVLRESVARSMAPGLTGCFLSGGTDSSTVAGMLRDVAGEAPHTFSIGFDAAGYDEMAFARIAARHFGTHHHEYYVTADDIVDSVPKVAAFYDQPFGNSSVVPAYRCAMLARDFGVDRILAGDGGDELFGGNVRYAKQTVFEAYLKLPRGLREGLLERAFGERTPLATVRPFSKAVSYISQARTPLPDRMQMYNLLTRLGPQQLFTPDFLGRIDANEPAVQQRRVFDAVDAKSLVNRMLGYDWKYTLADNDLPKVTGATSLAGIETGFPFLDGRVVDFSLRLEPSYKLKRLKLRWFFKEALRGYLPDEIIVKQKHGFGLPYGAWLVRGGPLLDMTVASLDSLGERGIIRTGFLQSLMRDLLPSAPGYYGELVWILMMLEQWWRRDDARRAGADR
jgi:asparagine synthase (glutamine-hydrolysing)